MRFSIKHFMVWFAKSAVKATSTLLLSAIAMWLALTQTAVSQTSSELALTTDEIVQRMTEMNRQRASALRVYEGTRVYRADYKGFPSDRKAEMVVSVNYVSPATKEFKVQSATGSKVIIDKVFNKALESEVEALNSETQKTIALNKDNYTFELLRVEGEGSSRTYVLAVEPKKKSKFLYRGTIWVDGKDFAVSRIEAEPAKNPSFWTRNVRITQQYRKVGDFWLPARNESSSSIRLGGHANFTIDYQDYRITDATPVPDSSAKRADVRAGLSRRLRQ